MKPARLTLYECSLWGEVLSVTGELRDDWFVVRGGWRILAGFNRRVKLDAITARLHRTPEAAMRARLIERREAAVKLADTIAKLEAELKKGAAA